MCAFTVMSPRLSVLLDAVHVTTLDVDVEQSQPSPVGVPTTVVPAGSVSLTVRMSSSPLFKSAVASADCCSSLLKSPFGTEIVYAISVPATAVSGPCLQISSHGWWPLVVSGCVCG